MKKILCTALFLLLVLSGCTKKKTWGDVAKKAQELEQMKAETMQVIGAKQ
jgi:outer membrane lipoprotein-sorting protein